MPRRSRTEGTAPRPRSDEEFVLAVDLGTGGPKVAWCPRRARSSPAPRSPWRCTSCPAGGPSRIPRRGGRRSCAPHAGAFEHVARRPSSVIGVGCTAQWSGTVAVDAAGTPLRPAVIWMDSRGSSAIRRQMRGQVSVLGYDVRKFQRWIRLTGGAPEPIRARTPPPTSCGSASAEPDVYAATYKFLEPVDWLNQRLTGRFSASFDSIAAHWVTDNRQIAAVDYDESLLQHVGTRALQAPRPRGPSATVMGTLRAEAAEELGLPAGLPVVTGTGDVHSAAVGSGAVEDFAGHLYIGTSSWISCHLPFKKTDAMHNVASIPAAIPGRYLVADEHETAGACLTFLAKTCFFDGDGADAPVPGNVYRQLRRGRRHRAGRVRTGPCSRRGSTGSGPRSTITPSGPGSTTSRSRRHRSDMVRAVYEGVALNSRWLLGGGGEVRGPALRRPSPSSAGAPTRGCGHRSTPMPWVAGSGRWWTPSSPTCAAPVCSRYWRSDAFRSSRSRRWCESAEDLRARPRRTPRCTTRPSTEFVNLYKQTKLTPPPPQPALSAGRAGVLSDALEVAAQLPVRDGRLALTHSWRAVLSRWWWTSSPKAAAAIVARLELGDGIHQRGRHPRHVGGGVGVAVEGRRQLEAVLDPPHARGDDRRASARYGLTSAPGIRHSTRRPAPWPTRRNPHVRLSTPQTAAVGAHDPGM